MLKIELEGGEGGLTAEELKRIDRLLDKEIDEKNPAMS